MISELIYHLDECEAPLKSPKTDLAASQSNLGGGFWGLVHPLRVWSLCAVPRSKGIP